MGSTSSGVVERLSSRESGSDAGSEWQVPPCKSVFGSSPSCESGEEHRDRLSNLEANLHWRGHLLRAPQERTPKSNNEQHSDFDKAPPPSALPSLLTGALTSYRSFRPTEGPEQEVKASA